MRNVRRNKKNRLIGAMVAAKCCLLVHQSIIREAKPDPRSDEVMR